MAWRDGTTTQLLSIWVDELPARGFLSGTICLENFVRNSFAFRSVTVLERSCPAISRRRLPHCLIQYQGTWQAWRLITDGQKKGRLTS
jgi:hypothetical protein